MVSKLIRFGLISTSISPFLLASTVLAQVGAPKLSIITPSESQTLYGQKVPILVAVENLTLVDYQVNKTRAVGQGHIHLWLDEENPTRESAVKLTKDDFTYSDVPYGEHTLRAELVNNDHTSLTPPVVTTVNFRTEPAATPSPIATSGFDKNTALVILVVVALVIVAAWWYTKEEDEELISEEAKAKPKRKVSGKKKAKPKRAKR